MEFDQIFSYGCFALGAVGWLAVLYTLLRQHPLPWINLLVAALAVLLIALPSDSKLVMQVGAQEGLKLELAELSKEIDSLQVEAEAMKTTLANLPSWAWDGRPVPANVERREKLRPEAVIVEEPMWEGTHQMQDGTTRSTGQ